MSVCTKRLAIDPGLRNGVISLRLGQAKKTGDNSGTGNLDEDNMIKSDPVETVFQSETSLNLYLA
jgi:hypothetical protein